MTEIRKIEKVCLCIALCMALVLTGWLIRERGVLVKAKTAHTQEALAGEVLRFHVLANSDSGEDQAAKMQVKEAVLAYMKRSMPEGRGIEETKAWAASHLGEIEDISMAALKEAGSQDTVSAELTADKFPAKTYGDVTFPAGTYEALRIRIGEAKGQNWWCCLYPNLCFTDAVHAVVPEEGKQELREVLSEDEYEMVTASSDFKIKWFFFGDASGED